MSPYLNRPAGADYYVTKSGNDAWTGTAENFQGGNVGPKLTIAAGLALIGTGAGAGANKVIQVNAGTYAEYINGGIPKGTSWTNPFTLRGRAGDTVTIQPSSGSAVVNCSSSANQWTIFDNVILDGVNCVTNNVNLPALLILFCNTFRFQNGEIKNAVIDHLPGAGANSLIYGFGTANEVLSSHLHDCESDYAIYCEGDQFIIASNHIRNTGGHGILIYSSINGTNLDANIIRYNRIHDCVEKRETGAGIAILGGDGNVCYNNLVYHCVGGNLADPGGQGLSLHTGAGAGTGTDAINTKAWNNTIYDCGWYGINATAADSCPASNLLTLQNNVAFSCNPDIDTTGSTSLTADHNVSGTDGQWTDPANGDFHLTGSTPASIHDAGTDLSAQFTDDFYGTTRPDGAAWDIGAAELVE